MVLFAGIGVAVVEEEDAQWYLEEDPEESEDEDEAEVAAFSL